ncbi:MAG TPA: altronate dehydratase [Clostridiaceae bacterium]|jgi:altronate hydrolase|nr:altronate dehydratase [Clostridiaceae bacterium]
MIPVTCLDKLKNDKLDCIRLYRLFCIAGAWKVVIKLDPRDNVAVALQHIKERQIINIDNASLVAKEPIAAAHKVAVRFIKKGGEVIKYGAKIGIALEDIEPGQWVHTHNIASALNEKEEYVYAPNFEKELFQNIEKETLFFNGFKRNNGLAGVRNEIWVIPTVACVNAIARTIAQKAANSLRVEGIDGYFAFTHPYGCSQLGSDHHQTQRILAGLVDNPNAGGVLVIGLGCENNNINEFKKVLGAWDSDRIRFLTAQDSADEVQDGVYLIRELAEYASSFKREPIPLSNLKIGMKCGGSDAFSGITANPLAGKISEAIVALGGTCVLTEVPEMFGAERILMNRAKDKQVFDRIAGMINGFKDYYIKNNQPIYENPSPGNKAGGISTLEEKSLGCIQKGGNCIITDVLDYGDKLRSKGLNLLEGPGNDLVSITALAASGCQIILFTTGRGNPLGTCVPTVKISSNTELYMKKSMWIDFDAGRLLTGHDMDVMAKELFQLIVKVASGECYTMNEVSDSREIGILKNGVTL